MISVSDCSWCPARSGTRDLLNAKLDQLAGYFDLPAPGRRKNQITHLRVGLQHRGDELRCADRSCAGAADVAGASVTASSGGISCVGVAMEFVGSLRGP